MWRYYFTCRNNLSPHLSLLCNFMKFLISKLTEIALIGCSISYFIPIINWLLTFLAWMRHPPIRSSLCLSYKFDSCRIFCLMFGLCWVFVGLLPMKCERISIVWPHINDWGRIQQFDLFKILLIEHNWLSCIIYGVNVPVHYSIHFPKFHNA